MGPPALVVLTTRAFQRAFFVYSEEMSGFQVGTCTNSWEHFPLGYRPLLLLELRIAY
jgi:hypothetical protein